jgi:lipoate-protein ligase A
MNHLDLTLSTPAENLACDEALLEEAEALGGEVLRFWESPVHFVVLGYANKAREEVDIEACRTRCVPILRRCSGGGTVLQGPGCLNYSVILRIEAAPELQSITETNRFVMPQTGLAPFSRHVSAPLFRPRFNGENSFVAPAPAGVSPGSASHGIRQAIERLR